MKRGLKGFAHLPSDGNSVAKRMKGIPAKMFAKGLAGFPHEIRYQNDNKVDATGKTQFRFFGDSYFAGSNASPSSLSVVNRLTAAYGISDMVNYAVGGRGFWNQAAAAQTASWTAGQVLIFLMCGFNDSRRGGSRPQTLKKIEAGFNGIVLKSLINTQVASGSTGVTRGGAGETFQGFGANTIGGTFQTGTLPGANLASFCNSGAGGTWTWTATFTAFAVQLFGSDGVTFTLGNATIHVDGVLIYTFTSTDWYDGISDGAYDNARGPVPLMFFGFASASHTVVVTSTSAASTAVDFFATLIPPTSINAPGILYFKQPIVPRQGYQFDTAPNGSPRDSYNADQVIINLINFYNDLGYKNFGVAETNKFLSQNNIDTDLVHYGNAGHGQMTRAGFNAIRKPVVLFNP